MSLFQKNIFGLSTLTQGKRKIPPLLKGTCGKIGLVRLAVIPAKAGIQYFFQAVKKFLDPGRDRLVPSFHRGDDKKAIFSQLQRGSGDLGVISVILGLVSLFLILSGCDYARMNDQESIRTYKKEVPEMDSRTVPIDRGYQFLIKAEPKALKNPLPPTPQTVEQGKLAYSYFCIHCHGPKADGNGTVGQSFALLPSNLAAGDVQDQTDGELFAKILLGFGRHPKLYTTVSETDTWALVNYIRSFAKNSPA